MAQVCNIVYEAFVEIKSNGSRMIDCDESFPSSLQVLSKLQEFLDYYFEEKESFVFGSLQKEDSLATDTASAELF